MKGVQNRFYLCVTYGIDWGVYYVSSVEDFRSRNTFVKSFLAEEFFSYVREVVSNPVCVRSIIVISEERVIG